MEFEQILQIIDHVSDSKLTSFEYEGDNVKLSMKCGKKTKIIADGVDKNGGDQDGKSAGKPAVQEGNLVKSPLVGTFYAAPAEDAVAFVTVGDQVKKGQILAIVEAMKLMNDIESEFDGRIAEIYVENGQSVEYGQPLFRIE
ncbi:MAG: acetyl-CoA carboxylase biotin carboxyl carrier protein [Eubacteriales bacterium]|nr:acetyl-CoA carboxylase biotin carboxyl carrier protein [Eubacteriales bacterium]